jgi:biopolymer transport protein TolR
VPYGVVVDVMAAAQRAGITNVGMITDPVGGGRASNKSKKDAKEARR